MHVDYEISEKDYLDGQRLAIKNSSVRMVRLMPFVLPCFGALGGVSRSWHIDARLFRERAPRNGFRSLLPVHSRMEQTLTKEPLRKSNALHGRLTLDVDDSGIHLGGPIT